MASGGPNRASEANVSYAASGRRSSLLQKLQQIMLYISAQAIELYDGDVSRVPCPDEEEWNGIASSRHWSRQPFPSVSVLTLYQNGSLQERAGRTKGGIRVAAFIIARTWLEQGEHLPE